MEKRRSFAVIGGDLRIIELANLLHADSYEVAVHGITAHDALKAPCSADLEDTIQAADIVILPLPMLDKDGNIFAPYGSEAIPLPALLKQMSAKQMLFSGNIPETAKRLAEIYGIYTVDYFKCEALTVTNAMLTAEGAIQTLLNAYTNSLCGSRVLLLGYGRIGKFLSKILAGFGAQVTIGGRRAETEAWVRSAGFDYIDLRERLQDAEKYDIVINTVPELILTQSQLELLRKEVILLDLASGRGGTDFAAAKARGIHAIHALSLPGKTAPAAAGKAIYDTVIRICNELGV